MCLFLFKKYTSVTRTESEAVDSDNEISVTKEEQFPFNEGQGDYNNCVTYLSLVVRKPVFGVSDQVRHKPGCATTEDGGIRGIVLSM